MIGEVRLRSCPQVSQAIRLSQKDPTSLLAARITNFPTIDFLSIIALFVAGIPFSGNWKHFDRKQDT